MANTNTTDNVVCHMIGHVDQHGLYPFNTLCIRCGVTIHA